MHLLVRPIDGPVGDREDFDLVVFGVVVLAGPDVRKAEESEARGVRRPAPNGVFSAGGNQPLKLGLEVARIGRNKAVTASYFGKVGRGDLIAVVSQMPLLPAEEFD